jgi:CDP-paratose 2-epimerase
MGKVDQGVFSWWLLSHLFGRPLSYIGYGGSGKQVRDLLHIDDLVDLVEAQLAAPSSWSGVTANVGGGRAGSLSLLETTALCRELTGNEVPIGGEPESRPGDVPVYLSDCGRLHSLTSWRPSRGPREVLADLLAWSTAHEDELRTALGFGR